MSDSVTPGAKRKGSLWMYWRPVFKQNTSDRSFWLSIISLTTFGNYPCLYVSRIESTSFSLHSEIIRTWSGSGVTIHLAWQESPSSHLLLQNKYQQHPSALSKASWWTKTSYSQPITKECQLLKHRHWTTAIPWTPSRTGSLTTPRHTRVLNLWLVCKVNNCSLKSWILANFG